MKAIISVIGAILLIIGVIGAVVSGEAYLLIWGLFFPIGFAGGLMIRYTDEIVDFLKEARL